MVTAYKKKKKKDDDTIRQLVQDMTLTEKIGQMSQIDIAILLKPGTKELDLDQANHYIGKLAVGSVLNLLDFEINNEDPSQHFVTAMEYRRLSWQLQNISATYQRQRHAASNNNNKNDDLLPPLLVWGLDSVHGANYLYNASLPPQPLNLAATFNSTMSYEAGRLASRDTRAAGIAWLFSPLIGIAIDSQWSRVYETFGEDPWVVGVMAGQMIRGIQQVDVNSKAIPNVAAACAKHFVGYSQPRNGHDRSPSWIPTRHLYQYFVPPWAKVLGEFDRDDTTDDGKKSVLVSQTKALTVMESYTEIDGVPNVANRRTTVDLLRRQLEFDGVLVTDYQEILNLNYFHRTAHDATAATIQSLVQSSVDMSMIPKDFESFQDGIHAGLDSHELVQRRLDESVERVLRLKLEYLNMERNNLLNNSNIRLEDDPNLALIGTDQDAVLRMATESLVLAKNDQQLLPLPNSNGSKILVTGPTASSRTYLAGGWTGAWQGAKSEEWFAGQGNTIVGALQDPGTPFASSTVTYSCGVNIMGGECDDAQSKQGILENLEDWVGLGPSNSMERAVEAAKDAGVVIVCVGEEAYAEKPGDIRSMDLPAGQYQLVRLLKAKTDAKIVLVYIGGRPRLMQDMADLADAVIVGFLPGPWGGPALAQLLSGKSNFSGKLPITYPKFQDGGGIPYFRSVSDQCTKGDGPLPHYENVACEVQWSFGHGLSYTTFKYSDLQVSGGHNSNDLQVSVTVQNAGKMAGADVVFAFTFDEYRNVTPEYKRLRQFSKVHLGAGESKRVEMTVPADDLRYVGPHDDSHYVANTNVRFAVGIGAHADCRENPDSELCAWVEPPDPPSLLMGYEAACSTACGLWEKSGCSKDYGLSTKSCLSLCQGISQYPNSEDGEVIGLDGWGWNYVNCLESVVWGMEKRQEGPQQCWKMTALCRDILATSNLDEFGMGPIGSQAQGGGDVNVNHILPNFVALAAALLSGVFMLRAIRGRGSNSRVRDSSIQFTPVGSDAEHSTLS